MAMSYKLDWLQGTVFGADLGVEELPDEAAANQVMQRVMSMLPLKASAKLERRADVHAPYKWGYKVHDILGLFYVPKDIQRIGVGYRATGQSLVTMNDGFLTYAALKAAGVRWSRIDFAFDFMGEGEDMKSLTILAREMLESAQTVTFYQKGGRPSGYTVCSRKSDVYIRVYDKALEQGKDYRWIRAEVEVKGDRIRAMAHSFTEAFGECAKILMEKALPPGTVMWDEMMSVFADGVVPTKVPPRAASNRERWLWSDVRSSFTKLIHENPDAATDYIQGLQLILAMELDKTGVRQLIMF